MWPPTFWLLVRVSSARRCPSLWPSMTVTVRVDARLDACLSARRCPFNNARILLCSTVQQCCWWTPIFSWQRVDLKQHGLLPYDVSIVSVNQNADSSQVQASPALPAAQPPQHQLDRSMNIVVFGLAEDRSHLVWRQNVDQALKFINGNE